MTRIDPLRDSATGGNACDTPVEQNIPQQRFRTVVGRMAQSQRIASQFRCDLIEGTPPVPTADIASVFNAILHQTQRSGFVPHNPVDTHLAQRLPELFNGFCELPLFNGHRHDFKIKRRTPTVRSERMYETQTVLSSGHADPNAVSAPKHLEPAHGTADTIEDFSFDVGLAHHNLPFTHGFDLSSVR